MERLVLDFKEVDKTSLPYVGGKGANLGELTKAGFRVPQGFCITTSAYEAFLETSDQMNHFFHDLDRMSPDDLTGIRSLAGKIRNHLQNLPLPDPIKSAISGAWSQKGDHKPYAVRSSATAEDLPTASFAGQQETYLNVRGEQQLLESVRNCWASLFTDRAISYRAKNGFDHRKVLLSVVVQEMVFPDVSGIMFTADPINGNRKVTAIDASFGIGEALVSGLVSADLYQVRDGQIIQKKISAKKKAIYAVSEGGTVMKDLPDEQQNAQALSDERILELAALGKKIEGHYGTEQDIEWCLAEEKFYIVQSRPITSLYPVPEVSDDRLHVFFSVGHQQMMTDAMSPLGMSVLRTMFPFAKAGAVRAESPAVLEAGSHLFFDPTQLLYLKPARRVLPKMFRIIDDRIGSAVAEVVQRPEFLHKPGPQLKRTVFRLILTAAKTVLPGWFVKDYNASRNKINRFIEQKIDESRRHIFEASGAERIVRIQENLGMLVGSILKNLAPYMFPGMVSKLMTDALVKKWLGDDANLHALNKSLPGNVTSEMGLMIGDLADIARKHPQAVDVLKHAKKDRLLERLDAVEGGPAFKQAFQQFLDQYGMRCSGEIDIANPRWSERPATLVPSILSNMQTMEPGEHREKFERGKKEAETAARVILAKVRKTPGGMFKAKILSRLIRNYRNFAGLREHPKYILIRHFDLYKRAILEEARTMVKDGKLERESDVFYLTLNELVDLEKGSFAGDVPQLIEKRMQKYQRDKKLTPPRVMTSEGEIITGKRAEMNVPEGALVGTPVSAGTVEGYAKVVLRPEEADLRAGEIMIAPFTDPGWTPLFHSAKALVMEVGGMMTHGAVVAREYGIPAVVGIDGATETIKDGDFIRVDGTRGYVEILKKQ